MKKFSDLRILIVEDSDDVRSMVRDMLASLEIVQVFEAENGKQAHQTVKSAFDFIDLIICDWNMPEMSGLDLLQEVRVLYPNIPFLMITGRGDADSVLSAKDSGANAYILKPFTLDQLEAKLRIVAIRSGLIA